VELFGVHLLGINANVLRKLILSGVVVVAAILLRLALRRIEDALHRQVSRRAIWTEKALRMLVGMVAILLLGAIWFDNPHNVAVFSGLVVGGVAVASQKLMQAVAGFFVIVFGKTFNLGDRIEMGGVRGDVLDIGLLKTTVMEMGVPESQQPDPRHWINARQYTGRIVTVVNSEVFEKPVFNYSRQFDYLWDEIQLPLKYDVDLRTAERIALEAVRSATEDIAREAAGALEKIKDKYLVRTSELAPRAYVRLTDNWIELSVRFVARPSGVRELKDRISRRLLTALQDEGIQIASTTFEVVGLPTVRLEATAEELHSGAPEEMQ
jgi:small-conductance mechanosensitive channel